MDTPTRLTRTGGTSVAFLLLCMLLPFPAGAQGTGRIQGVVRDADTRAPLPAANVFLNRLRQGAFTDREGRFTITGLSPVVDHLVVSYMGYRRKELPVTLTEGQVLVVEVLLEPHPVEMGNLTVTASRRAESEFRSQQAVTIASPEEIARRAGGSTADALREEPGVMVQKTTAGHGTPIIRGMIGKDVLLLYNGVRLNKPTFRPGGNQYMDTIDAEALDRIEVVRGPGSVLYGSDAIGGTVNLIARPPAFTEDAGWAPRARLRYTTADAGKSVHAGLLRFGPVLTAQAGITARRTGDLVAGGAIGAQHPTGYDEISGHLLTSLRLSEHQTVRADYLDVRQSNVPRYDQYVSGKYDTYLYEPQDRVLALLAYQHLEPTSWMNSLEWNVSYQFEQEGRLQHKPGSTRSTADDDRITTLGTFLQGTSVLGGGHVLQYGTEYYTDTVKSTRMQTEPDTMWSERGAFPDGSEFNSLGAYFSDEVSLGEETDLSAGLRYSAVWYSAPLGPPFGFYSDAFKDLTGNVGISHRIRPGVNLVASVARGFRAPNFNDTVVLKATNSGVDAPSPGLLPEISTNYEVGSKVEWTTGDLEVFAFYNALSDIIVARPGTYLGLPYLDENGNNVQDPGEPDIEQKENAAKAFITGIEMQGAWRVSEMWRIRGNAFYTYGAYETDDEPFRRIPPLMGLAGLQWIHGGATYELFVRAAAAQHRLSAEDIDDTRIGPEGTAGWSDWNLRMGTTVGPTRVEVTLGNILDHAYKEHGSGVYNPGRYLVVSLGWAAFR